MNVTVIAQSPDWLNVLYSAMKTCHSVMTPQELYSIAGDAPEEKKIKAVLNLARLGHLSVLEHVSVTFAVSGVSRSLLAQYSRHRIGVSLSVQSQRYVKTRAEGFELVCPQSVENNNDAARWWELYKGAVLSTYTKLADIGVPLEDARFVLPNAATTNFITTLNLRALLDVYHKRVTVKGAQWEIRDLLQTMARLVIEREPWMESLFLNVNGANSGG